MSEAFDHVLAKFEKLARVTRSRDGFMTHCPAHDDETPSLSISEKNGTILLNCFASCKFDAILAAAGIEKSELRSRNGNSRAKKRPFGEVVATYPYVDERGVLLYEIQRDESKNFRPCRKDSKGRLVYDAVGVPRVLYHLQDVRQSEEAVVVEGEKDADTARAMGICATTSPFGANSPWLAEYSETLRGKHVAIVADADKPGRDKARQIAFALSKVATSVRLLEMPGAKDFTEWVERGGTKAEFQALINATEEWKASGRAAETQQPTITLSAGELPRVVDEAEAALLPHAERLGVFQRGGELVRVARLAAAKKNGGLRRPEGSVILEPLQPLALTEIFERLAVFQRYNRRGDAYQTDCPPRLAATYLGRTGAWKLSILAGTIFAPLMRSDGTILSRQGFDETTGLYLVSDEEWFATPERPTRQDAIDALEALRAPFVEFPFVEKSDESVHLTAILTGIQRRVLEATPLIAYSAPTQRSGKSILAESVATIATGKPAAATGTSPEREEIRKAVTSSLREGHAVVNLDNVVDVLDSPDLARAITQSEYMDRLLGENRMLRLPTNVLWTATGNNLTFRGDLSSRTLLCRIDPKTERPEEREFNVRNLPAYIVENRRRLVVAALTILRAHHLAGRPHPENMKQWGGFEDWSASIRAPLVWAGATDPYETRANVLADDPDLEMAREAFNALYDVFQGTEFLVREVVDRCDRCDPEKSLKNEVTLRDAMLNIAARRNAKDQLDPRRLGWWLRHYRGRVLSGLRLVVWPRKLDGAVKWAITEEKE